MVFHNPTHQVQPATHHQRSDSPPHSSSVSYLRELGGDQSRRLGPLQHLLLTSGWMDGLVLGGEWGGGVAFTWPDRQLKVTQVGASVVAEFL